MSAKDLRCQRRHKRHRRTVAVATHRYEGLCDSVLLVCAVCAAEIERWRAEGRPVGTLAPLAASGVTA